MVNHGLESKAVLAYSYYQESDCLTVFVISPYSGGGDEPDNSKE